MPKYILFLAKLKGEERPFWNGEPSLTCGDNVNYYKSVLHPIPTFENRELLGNFQNKSVSSAFNWVSRYILFLAKLKGKGKLFVGPERRATLWDYPQWHLVVIREEKVSPFVKFEIILHLLCFILHLLTNKLCRTWSSIINLWIDSRTYQSKEACCQQEKGLTFT